MDQTVNASADPGANSTEAPRPTPNLPTMPMTGARSVQQFQSPTAQQPPMPADAELSASMNAEAAAMAADVPPDAQNTPSGVTMSYAGVTLAVPAADVDAHTRAGWTTNGPDAAPAA